MTKFIQNFKLNFYGSCYDLHSRKHSDCLHDDDDDDSSSNNNNNSSSCIR